MEGFLEVRRCLSPKEEGVISPHNLPQSFRQQLGSPHQARGDPHKSHRPAATLTDTCTVDLTRVKHGD